MRTLVTIVGLIVLIIVALITTPPAGAKPSSGYTPICTEVTATTLVLDGLYVAVDCPQGRLTVSRRGDQPTPALGPARVAPSSAAGFYDLIAAGERYRISR